MRVRLARLGLVLALIPSAAATAFSFQAPKPTGRWAGQDGKDFVGLRPEPGPSGVVDVRLALSGLPRRPIVWAQVSPVGGGRWHTGKPGDPLAHLVRDGLSPKADLYVEPYQVENGKRDYEVQIQFDAGPVVYVWIKGGKADPAVRTAAAKGTAKWVGMTTEDRAGLGPNVGPDGLHDAKILLGKLDPKAEVEAVEVRTKDGAAWIFGINPQGANNAEFVRHAKERSQGDLYLQPDRDLTGQTLDLRVAYKGGAADLLSLTAGKTTPGSVVPIPKVSARFTAVDAKVRWLGQDGVKRTGAGDVHVVVDGVNPQRRVVAAELSDRSGTVWAWKGEGGKGFHTDRDPLPLELDKVPGGALHLAFPPVGNEEGRPMTLRLGFADGLQTVVYFPAGKADPALRAVAPAETSVDARPGDDLHALADRFGTIRLAPGIHRLTRPLVLNRPVNLLGAGKAVLEFAQAGDQPPWTAAIKIHAGRTTLDGFAVRFAGPVRWDRNVGHGPAVIGTTDDRDQGRRPPKVGIEIVRLDVVGPPSGSGWEDAVSAVRLTNAESGRIEENTIVGGTVEFWGGPWKVARNRHKGAVANTHAPAVFCGHYTRDLMVEANQADNSAGTNGKVWRFLVLTQRGYHDVVRDNVVEGIGAREDDPHPHPNAPEILLTEAYRVRFEGKPFLLQGALLKTPTPQGDAVAAGDVFAVLTGPNAGQWCVVSQNLGESTYLLDRAWPAGLEKETVAIVTGFVEDRFERNTVDTRGSTICFNLVLAGNLFGVKVEQNRFVGGGEGFKLLATASEAPVHWGWSHAPVFGASIVGNRVEDAWTGSRVAVEHSDHVKTSRGRTYLQAVAKGNTFAWTDALASRRLAAKGAEEAAGLILNDPRPFDPSEMTVDESDNHREGGASIPSIRIHGAKVNGRVVRSGVLDFAPATSAVRGANLSR